MRGSRESHRLNPRDHLLTRVLPFWERHGVDGDHGGFLTHLTQEGEPSGASDKFLVTQTRMIYSFAAGAALGGPPEWLNLARQGTGFLLEHFRDREHDGWFWSVSRQGQPREAAKRTYGHAFVIYALAEYGRIARDSRALAAADHTWSLLVHQLSDAEHDGFLEGCDPAWEPTEGTHRMGTHLHVLEALLALREALDAQRYWPRVRGVCDLIVGRMVEDEHRCGLEHFQPDWTPDRAGPWGLVNYGHNLEAAWLLLRVNEIERSRVYQGTARGFLDYVLRFGLDTVRGGIFSHGPLGRAATVREKIWWVQTEALVAFLLGYLAFQDPRYREAFENVASFCLRCLHDPKHAEWYHSTEEDGTARNTAKGSAWKAAYHVTQACVYAHEYLSRIAGQP